MNVLSTIASVGLLQVVLLTFLHGGCATPFGACKRETKCITDDDRYEPHSWGLKKHGLPELFFVILSVSTTKIKKNMQKWRRLFGGEMLNKTRKSDHRKLSFLHKRAKKQPIHSGNFWQR